MTTAASKGLSTCHLCFKLAPADVHRCPRCDSAMHLRKNDSIQRTLALLITAGLLYIPANLYPIMYTDQLGTTEASTIVGGVILLINLGSAPVALVIFVFSVMVPSGKLLAMFYLVWTVERHSPLDPRQRSIMYRVTEFVGKWSMVDVFVVSILVALIHLSGVLVIRPGVAAICFAGVVIITMVAAESFDARLIWDNMSDDMDDESNELQRDAGPPL
jgi:paraquat-inducible protein A|tara:strand:+ start:6993 stop:7643 length:651 start_codon:yes stop_codon:yes gene_type:complete